MFRFEIDKHVELHQFWLHCESNMQLFKFGITRKCDNAFFKIIIKNLQNYPLNLKIIVDYKKIFELFE